FGEQPGKKAGGGAARLVELDGGRAPGGPGAGRLAAGEAEGVAHAQRRQAAQMADRSGGAERADDAGQMPAALAGDGIVDAGGDAHGNLGADGERGEEGAAVAPVLLGDGKRGRDDLRADVDVA